MLQGDRASVRVPDYMDTFHAKVGEEGKGVMRLFVDVERTRQRIAARVASAAVTDQAIPVGESGLSHEREKAIGDVTTVTEEYGLTLTDLLVLQSGHLEHVRFPLMAAQRGRVGHDRGQGGLHRRPSPARGIAPWAPSDDATRSPNQAEAPMVAHLATLAVENATGLPRR